jgi:hypothetical protein
MRNFTKSLLALALMFVCVGGVKAKQSVNLPGPWDGNCVKTDNSYSFNGWAGGSAWVGADWTAYDFVWIKYSGYTGSVRFGIIYDEFVKNGDYGPEYKSAEVILNGSAGVAGIRLDKTSVCEIGGLIDSETAGAHVGDLWLQHVRQIEIQSRGVTSTLTIEGIYIGTEAEFMREYEPAYYYLIDWTSQATYNMWHAEFDKYTYNIEIANNLLKITNTDSKNQDGSDKVFWHVQYSVANNIPLIIGIEYQVNLKIKASAEADIVWVLGDWGHTIDGHINVTTEWKEIKINVTAPWSTNFFNLQTGNLLGTIEIEKVEVTLNNRTISVGEAGYTTYSSDKAIDVEGVVTAYAAKYSGGKIVLTPVTKIPAGAGVIIEAAEGSHKVPVVESADALGTINELIVSDGTATGDGTHVFALGKKDDKVGFVKVKSGVIIPAGKAYLYIATPPTSRDFLGFDDETTGIESVEQAAKADNQYFNLAGQRVAQPTKGLYIVNGKKVIIK